MRTEPDHLITKLDEFIRKYYRDQLVRGALYSMGLLVVVFLVVTLLEHIGRFGTGTRTVLFWTSVVAMVVIVARFVALPLVKLFRIEQAHLGDFFLELSKEVRLEGPVGHDGQVR
jgi:hypothetical protein